MPVGLYFFLTILCLQVHKKNKYQLVIQHLKANNKSLQGKKKKKTILGGELIFVSGF